MNLSDFYVVTGNVCDFETVTEVVHARNPDEAKSAFSTSQREEQGVGEDFEVYFDYIRSVKDVVGDCRLFV